MSLGPLGVYRTRRTIYNGLPFGTRKEFQAQKKGLGIGALMVVGPERRTLVELVVGRFPLPYVVSCAFAVLLWTFVDSVAMGSPKALTYLRALLDGYLCSFRLDMPFSFCLSSMFSIALTTCGSSCYMPRNPSRGFYQIEKRISTAFLVESRPKDLLWWSGFSCWWAMGRCSISRLGQPTRLRHRSC